MARPAHVVTQPGAAESARGISGDGQIFHAIAVAPWSGPPSRPSSAARYGRPGRGIGGLRPGHPGAGHERRAPPAAPL